MIVLLLISSNQILLHMDISRQRTYHLIFDVKMNFTCKVSMVADGHKVPEPSISPHAHVVSQDTVRIAFTYEALNDLDTCASDIKNTYLQAHNSENYYTS